MATPDDEQAWVRQARAGDHQAYRLLVERHQSRLYRVVARLLGPDYVGLGDVTQDVLVRAYFALARFRGASSFGTWLMRIAVNRCRDELRRTASRRALEWSLAQEAARADYPAMDVDAEDADASTDAMGRLVQDAVATLPEKLRVVVSLKDLEGYSYEDVSQILRCSVGTVKSRHSRGRKKLQQLLGPSVLGLKQ